MRTLQKRILVALILIISIIVFHGCSKGDYTKNPNRGKGSMELRQFALDNLKNSLESRNIKVNTSRKCDFYASSKDNTNIYIYDGIDSENVVIECNLDKLNTSNQELADTFRLFADDNVVLGQKHLSQFVEAANANPTGQYEMFDDLLIDYKISDKKVSMVAYNPAEDNGVEKTLEINPANIALMNFENNLKQRREILESEDEKLILDARDGLHFEIENSSKPIKEGKIKGKIVCPTEKFDSDNKNLSDIFNYFSELTLTDKEQTGLDGILKSIGDKKIGTIKISETLSIDYFVNDREVNMEIMSAKSLPEFNGVAKIDLPRSLQENTQLVVKTEIGDYHRAYKVDIVGKTTRQVLATITIADKKSGEYLAITNNLGEAICENEGLTVFMGINKNIKFDKDLTELYDKILFEDINKMYRFVELK